MPLTLDQHTSNQISMLLDSNETNIVDMAKEIGENVSSFFQFGDWSDLDLRPCDLTDVSFNGSNICNTTVYADQFEGIFESAPYNYSGIKIFFREDKSGHLPSLDHKDYWEKRDRLARLIAKNNARTINQFNKLIFKCEIFSDGLLLLYTMERRGIDPNNKTFSALMSISGSLDDAIGVLESMQRRGLQPSIENLHNLISKSKGVEEARRLLTELNKFGLKPNQSTWNLIASLRGTFDETVHLLDEMRRNGFRVDKNTYVRRLRASLGFEEAQKIANLAYSDGHSVGPDIYNELMKKAPDLATGQDIKKNMIKSGVNCDTGFYNMLISLAQTIEEVEYILAEMANIDIHTDSKTIKLIEEIKIREGSHNK